MDTLYIIHIRDWHNKNPTDPEEIVCTLFCGVHISGSLKAIWSSLHPKHSRSRAHSRDW